MATEQRTVFGPLTRNFVASAKTCVCRPGRRDAKTVNFRLGRENARPSRKRRVSTYGDGVRKSNGSGTSRITAALDQTRPTTGAIRVSRYCRYPVTIVRVIQTRTFSPAQTCRRMRTTSSPEYKNDTFPSPNSPRRRHRSRMAGKGKERTWDGTLKTRV